jgi:phenolic acid decarboxylase
MPPAFDPAAFDCDLWDVHLIYDYAAEDAQGQAQSWQYETWFFSDLCIVYAIHGRPMAGCINFQTATYQCIHPGELWQVNWLEETGTIVSLIYNIPRGTIMTLIAFSKGHWDNLESAHGDKCVSKDFECWRTLRKIGDQGERVMLSKQAMVVEKYMGKGDLKPIKMSWPTM